MALRLPNHGHKFALSEIVFDAARPELQQSRSRAHQTPPVRPPSDQTCVFFAFPNPPRSSKANLPAVKSVPRTPQQSHSKTKSLLDWPADPHQSPAGEFSSSKHFAITMDCYTSLLFSDSTGTPLDLLGAPLTTLPKQHPYNSS